MTTTLREPAQNPDQTPSAAPHVRRRTVAAGMAWSLPVIAASAPAHAAAASCAECLEGPLAHHTRPGTYTLVLDHCVTQVKVEVAGGGGGDSAKAGGNGALLTCLLALPEGGSTLTLVVGDNGQSRGQVWDQARGGGYARGGYGGIRAGKVDGGGGGGSSALLVAGQPLLIAGGGGGGANATSLGGGVGDAGEGGNGWGIPGTAGSAYGVSFAGGLGAGEGIFGTVGGPASTSPFPVFGPEVLHSNTGRGAAGGDAGDGRGGDGHNASTDQRTWNVGASGGGGGGGYAGGAGGDAAFYTEDEVYVHPSPTKSGGGGAGGGGGTCYIHDAPVAGVVMSGATGPRPARNGRTVASAPGWINVTCV